MQQLQSEFNVFFLDDGTLGGSLEGVLEDFSTVERMAGELGLQVNRDKSKVICDDSSTSSPTLESVLDMHNAVFNEELGCVQGMSAKIHVEPRSTPQFCKARPVPFALRGRVEQELDRLHESEVIKPVEYAEWAAPIVPVIKSDGSVCICGDYKVTVNRVAKVDSYPLPRIDDLFASLAVGKLRLPTDSTCRRVQEIRSHRYPQGVIQV